MQNTRRNCWVWVMFSIGTCIACCTRIIFFALWENSLINSRFSKLQGISPWFSRDRRGLDPDLVIFGSPTKSNQLLGQTTSSPSPVPSSLISLHQAHRWVFFLPLHQQGPHTPRAVPGTCLFSRWLSSAPRPPQSFPPQTTAALGWELGKLLAAEAEIPQVSDL